MDDYYYFTKPNVVEVNAALVGISRGGWVSVPDQSDKSSNLALKLMKKYNFDIIPIDSNEETISNFYKTKNWGGFDDNEISEIDENCTIHFRTPIDHVISKMERLGVEYFLLSNSEDRIVGLITSSNLNCRDFGTLLFSHIIGFEMAMTQFIESEISEDEIESYAMGKKDLGKRIDDAKKANAELPTIQLLSLSDLIGLFEKSGCWRNLGFESKSKCHKMTQKVIELRNDVAHQGTGKTIINSKRSVPMLWKTMRDLKKYTTNLQRLTMGD